MFRGLTLSLFIIIGGMILAPIGLLALY